MEQKVALYCRVSSKKNQQTEQQLSELHKYCRSSGFDQVTEYVDEGVSAFKKLRPEFTKLKSDIRKRKINVVVIWKLDRLSRSLIELVTTMEFFREYGVKFVSYSQPLDTSTSTGKLLFHVFSMIAEFERSLISERTKLKLALLKEKGVKLGRPIKTDAKAVCNLLEEGLTKSQVAAQLGCSRITVYRAYKAFQKGYQKTPHEKAELQGVS
ncbi:recombinase family protein [Candidatus Margulisiibacteriota bacterium]